MRAVGHPGSDRLEAYYLGQLPPPESEAVARHLGTCPDCRAHVEALKGSTGSFSDGPTVEPEIVAGHELRGELARGGLGVVYLAFHPVLGDFRAIKRPRMTEGLNRDLVLARFRREVQAVGGLRHDHVIRAHDAGSDAEGPYLVMEYLQGDSLAGLLRRHRQLSVAVACELVRQAALGLQAAHERGLVHRDVKPSNLMLARANSGARVVVIDWGLVKRTGANAAPADELTALYAVLGTPDYVAPEQVRDASSVDVRADVYSLGTTLYCLLAGRPPFYDRPAANKLQAHEREAFPPLDRLRADLPPGLPAVLAKMVEKDPRRRYASAGAAAEALQPFCAAPSALPALLGASAGPPSPPPLPQRRRRLAVPLAAAAGLLLLVGLVLSLLLRSKPVVGRTEPAAPADGADAPVSMAGHPGYCGSLAFTADGLHAVSESGGGGVYFWDLQKRTLEKSQLHGFKRPEENQQSSGVVAVSPDGNLIAAAGAIPPFSYMNLVELYDQKNFKLLKNDFAFFSGTLGRAVAFSPGKPGLFATEDLPGLLPTHQPRVRIIEVDTGKNWKMFPSSSSPVHCFAFSPDGKLLAIAGNEKSIRLRDLEHDRQHREFRGNAASADQVAFSSDGTRLFSVCGGDGTLRVWNNEASAGEVVETELTKIELGKVPARLLCAALWPGGRALTGHEDGTLVLWDLRTGAERKRFTDPGNRVTAVALSPDGRQALAARADRLVYLYRLPSE
jgi:serine/threonine protein kinase